MKKAFLLFLLCFFFIPFNCFATSFTVNDTEYQVTDMETLRDYCYFTYKKNNSNVDLTYLLVQSNHTCITGYSDITNLILYKNSDNNLVGDTFKTYVFDTNYSYSTSRTLYNGLSVYWDGITYSSLNLYTSNSTDSALYLASNFTFSEIESKYISSTEPEPEPSEPDPVESLNSISRNDFYVLLMLLSTLIFMLFFRWCFPMKGGKNL